MGNIFFILKFDKLIGYRYTGGLFQFRITNGGFRYTELSTSHVGTAPHILNLLYLKGMNCKILRLAALPPWG